MIPLLPISISLFLMALGVVREKELGSTSNIYVTPVIREHEHGTIEHLLAMLGVGSIFFVLAQLRFRRSVTQTQV